ncbi:unnamed protein product [Penicillium pancosmium]
MTAIGSSQRWHYPTDEINFIEAPEEGGFSTPLVRAVASAADVVIAPSQPQSTKSSHSQG